MKKSLTSGFVVATALVTLALGILYIPIQQNQNALGAYNSPTNPSSISSNVQSSAAVNSSIALSVKQDGGVYKWTNATNGVENPELNLKTNANNTIQIENPTDTKHELVIDLQGKEVTTSGDIAPGASGQATFRPNGTGTYNYHCEYHPDTMKGTIKLTGP